MNDYRSVNALAEALNAGLKYPTFSTHAIRHYVRHAECNGLAPAVRRIGRKILISESGFLDWLNDQPRKAA